MSFATVLSFLLLTHAFGAQLPGIPAQPSTPAPQQAVDPLDRATPRGTIATWTARMLATVSLEPRRLTTTCGLPASGWPLVQWQGLSP